METIAGNNQRAFRRGDKVIYKYSGDENMIGTVSSVFENRCIVSFFIPGRRTGGYTTEMEFDASELEPCYVDIQATKRKPA